ncbi:MAG: IS110 family transposase [Candidatus Falkowbacteria bacterium]
MKKEKPRKGIVKMGSGLPVFNPCAAGIDIGDTLHCVAINDGNGGHEVKTTSAFTCDLHEIVDYCKSNGVTTVAMESTGVYWLVLYLLLEEAGIEPYLVNAKHAKNVTGRKKDDTDSIWLQKLHTCGLLQKSYQPDNEIRLLRSYTRQRKNLILLGSDSIRRMQKALELMNIKIHTVISDILGKTGMGMVKAIIAGERNPEILSTLCDPRIKASREDIIKSLDGIWKEEYLFMLEQAVDNYEFLQKQVKSCEQKIQQQLLKQVALLKDGDITGLEETPKKKSKAKKNQFDYSLLPYLKSIAGVDLCQIQGISEVTALEFISEVGADMSKWKSSKHFAAWLNLTPNTKISGGKIISSKMIKKNNKAGQLLRQAASCLITNKTPIGDYYRVMRARLGGKGAALATAHKLARIIYAMLSKKTEYNSGMIVDNQEKIKEEKIQKLEKQLARLKQAA